MFITQLGLSVSDVLLSGCYPVIVEGPSDQYVLSAIKQRLISEGIIKPNREIVFLPAGGNKGIAAIASVLGMSEGLPPVLFDGDRPGQESAKNLKKAQYKERTNRVHVLSDYLEILEPEVEDLMPFELVERHLNRVFIEVEDEAFGDFYDDKKPIVPQVEEFARKHGVSLKAGKWKVDMAKAFKQKVQNGANVDGKMLDTWKTVVSALLSDES